MNRFEIELLKNAYENYRKSGEATGITLGSNEDDLFYYSNALVSLVEQEYAVPTSDNYNPSLVTLRVSYELTDKGLEYAKVNLVG